jgi:hypothetical protein
MSMAQGTRFEALDGSILIEPKKKKKWKEKDCKIGRNLGLVIG